MNQKISVKKLGKNWVILNYVVLTILIVLASIYFFIDNTEVHSFMLLYVSPIAMLLFLVYFSVIIFLNLKKDKKEA